VFNNSTDLWQLKIMSVLVKKQLANASATTDSISILSIEILNSLLMRLKMLMSRRMKERKHVLRTFLAERNLNFVTDFCLSSLQELIQLVIYFGLSLNFLEEPLNLENVNLMQFMYELKKRQGVSLDPEFAINLWKLVKD